MGASSPRAARVLIVEDEDVVARALARILSDAGHDVVGRAQSGSAAIELARREKPDLVLLDIRLQDAIDGIRVAEEVKAPLLFVSGRSDDQTLAAARRLGARGFVVKPFSPRQVVAAVQVALATPPEKERELSAEEALALIATTLRAAGLAAPTTGPQVRELPGVDELTAREREVLEELLGRYRPFEIAKRLHISPHTVRNHIKSIYQKLDVHSQAELLEKMGA